MSDEGGAAESAGGNVTAIVVSYRTGEILFEALGRLLAEDEIAHVVLADNGNPPSTEQRLDALAAAEAKLTVLRGHGNVGFARGCNLAVAAARARAPEGVGHVLFANPDACIEPGAVGALKAAGAALRASVGKPWIAGARILDATGREQRGGRRNTPTLAGALGAVLGRDRVHLENEPAPEAPIKVGAVSGAAMMMNAGDFLALGGFDEGYFLHAEDLDLCRRVIDAGGDVVFVPDARVRHVGGTSAAPSTFVEWCKGRGLARYFVKFARGPVERALAILLGPLIVAAAVARGVIPRGGDRS
ncbi:MAG: glycosyltransferase family 2 protein [Maricaulaceae bacterium]|jgi:GT2 family glycosyltransferase